MTREILLTGGRAVALVDDEDYDTLSMFTWGISVSGPTYARRYVWFPETRTRTSIVMHRQIMNPPAGMLIDHINRNGLDNRKCNLRIATNSQNQHNKIGFHGRRFKGIYKNGNRWQARIKVQGKDKHLGCFADEVAAARAYNLRRLSTLANLRG